MWGAIEADFDREYRFDLSVPGALRSKTWRWFTTRLSNLSSEAITRHKMNQKDKTRAGGAMDALQTASQRKD